MVRGGFQHFGMILFILSKNIRIRHDYSGRGETHPSRSFEDLAADRNSRVILDTNNEDHYRTF